MARIAKGAAKETQLDFGLATTPSEAFKRVRNYLAGQHVGATRDEALLEEVLKCLFCKIIIERGLAQTPPQDADPFELAKALRGIYSQARREFPEILESKSEILLDPASLAFVFRTLSFSVMDPEHDPVGDAFEAFVGSESQGKSGQFFTPRAVTALLVDAIAPQLGETVLDPACGAGGFLTAALSYQASRGATVAQLAKATSEHLFGVDKDAYLAKLAQTHLSLLTGGHAHIVCGDSLALTNGNGGLLDHLPKTGVDVLLTNPPFGVKIIAARPEVLKTFDLARRWMVDKTTGRLAPTNELAGNVPPQVLFIERSLSLLKPGGRLGMVVPESLLSSKSYRNVVEYLLDRVDLQGVLGMPDALFKTSGKGGTHTKTCLLIARKKAPRLSVSPTVFMAEAKWCGKDSRARVIPLNDLPAIANSFRIYSGGKKLKPTPLGFVMKKADIASNVLCPRYYDPQPAAELEALRETHDLPVFGDLVRDGVLSISTGDEIGKLAYGTGTIPFIRTSDISNWEIKADPKHGVSNEIYNTLRMKQDVRAADLLMVKDGTYLVGTCAIVSKLDERILYQSHIYKIRVNENKMDLNPYLLLASLSCSVVQRQIRSKQFTQDIIDSLGDRINELVIPLPRSKKLRLQITEKVRAAVDHRNKARELAQEARTIVAA